LQWRTFQSSTCNYSKTVATRRAASL